MKAWPRLVEFSLPRYTNDLQTRFSSYCTVNNHITRSDQLEGKVEDPFVASHGLLV